MAGRCNGEHLARLKMELSALPPPVSCNGNHLSADRAMVLDSVFCNAREIDTTTGRQLERSKIVQMGFPEFSTVDWEIAFRTVNQRWEEYEKMLDEPDPWVRLNLLKASNDRLLEEQRQLRDAGTFRIWIGRRGIGRRVAGIFIVNMSPDILKPIYLEFQAKNENALLQIAIALEELRQKTGDYPQRLDDLVPEFLDSVPVDLVDNRPFLYSMAGDPLVASSPYDPQSGFLSPRGLTLPVNSVEDWLKQNVQIRPERTLGEIMDDIQKRFDSGEEK
jgi:hypothetical protein